MKPTSNQIEHALETVRILFNNDFYKAISYQKEGRAYYLGWFDWCEDHCDWLEEQHITVFRGETKACIINSDLADWVIKIGFREKPYRDFDEHIDYMNLEAEYYEEAQKANLGEFFAETYNIGAVDNVDVILQEYARPDEDKISSFFFSYAESTFGYQPGDYVSEEEYLDAVSRAEEDMDTEERVEAIFGRGVECSRLVDFIEEKEINDLHSGNWGITKDGRVVIFDFSGYYG